MATWRLKTAALEPYVGGVRFSNLPRALRRSVAAGLVAWLAAAPGMARAEGFDARIFRPSTDRFGAGTIDGAQAPESGVLVAAASSDTQLSPVTLYRGDLHTDVVAWRASVEPSLTIGLGSSFALFARAPFVVADRGSDASGATLPSSGLLPPAAGVLIPILRQPLNEGHLALRGEVAAPVGSPEQFSGDGAVTGRGALVYGEDLGRAFFLVSAGAQVAPLRGVGNARLGSAALGGIAARYPRDAEIAVVGSLEARIDLAEGSQSSAMISAGADLRIGELTFRLLAGAGIHDVIGTPSAMFSLAWLFDVRTGSLPSAPSVEPSVPAQAPLAEPTAFARGDRAPPAPIRSDDGPRLLLLAIPPVLFATASDELDHDAMRGLFALAAALNAAPSPLVLRIVGHADRRGGRPYNAQLGADRADAVRRFLIDLGVPPSWIRTESAGADRPARGGEASEADELRDRRVEILAEPLPGREEPQHASR